MRRKLFDIIEPASDQNKASSIYDIIMMITIITSIIPLAFKNAHPVFQIVEYLTIAIFIIDYLLRLFTADLN